MSVMDLDPTAADDASADRFPPPSRPVHPWVAERRDRPRFALQAGALPDDPEPSRTLLQAGRLTEAVGLDAFCIADHPGTSIDPWPHLTAVAVETERIGVGSVVNCVLHRHPTLLARLAADLDRLSAGRLLLGLGIGWNAPEFAQLGLAFPSVPQRQDALDEALMIVTGVWGTAPFTFGGNHWRTDGGHVGPWPSARRPPILIAGSGERRTLRQVARWADASNFGASPTAGGVASADDVRRKLAVLRQRCDEIGRPYDAILRTHFTSWLMLGETEAAAERKLRRYHPDGVPPDKRATRIALTPEGAVAHYRALADAGLQYFVIQIFDGRDEETIRLLGEVVAPLVGAASG